MPALLVRDYAPAFRVQDTEKKLFFEGRGGEGTWGPAAVGVRGVMEGSKPLGRLSNEPDQGGLSLSPKNRTPHPDSKPQPRHWLLHRTELETQNRSGRSSSSPATHFSGVSEPHVCVQGGSWLVVCCWVGIGFCTF